MNYLENAEKIEQDIIKDRRTLHQTAELGFDLENTCAYVKKRLDEMGVQYREVADSGIVAQIGNGNECFLLRADMDALPINEEYRADFKSKNGNMHACGHDAHTAMLLGAAKLLKNNESQITGCVKLLFQPAEEILEGAKRMIENGVLDDPTVGAAAMLHVIVGTELESGSVIVSSGGISAPAADYFKISLKGKGAHGSTPEKAKDPISVGVRIAMAIDAIKSRELALSERAVISLGIFKAGNAPNVIPDTAVLQGSMRAYSQSTRRYIKERIVDIAVTEAELFGVKAEVVFPCGCPALENSHPVSAYVQKRASELLPSGYVTTSNILTAQAETRGVSSAGAGSEDFAYIAQRVPSVMVGLCAGKASDGYVYPLHHPQFSLDESALKYGAALLAEIAEKWQNDLI